MCPFLPSVGSAAGIGLHSYHVSLEFYSEEFGLDERS